MIGNRQKDFCADVAFSFGDLCFDDRMKSFEDQEESDVNSFAEGLKKSIKKSIDDMMESLSIDDMMESFKEELKKQLKAQ